jgi:LPXTG-motif cell wall-anchored protein
VGDTSTTVGVNVLGEQFSKPSGQVAGAQTSAAPLARTGSDTRALLFWAGLALALGGLAALFGDRLPGRETS